MSGRVLVTLDGRFHDPDQPLLCADDLAAVRGDGIFETMLVRGGAACGLELHLARLATSAVALDLPTPELDRWRNVVDLAVGAWTRDSTAEGALRLVISRGREIGGDITGYVTVGPVHERVASARAHGVSAITLNRGYSVDFAAAAPWQLLGAKTLSYATNMAALRHAARLGADDVIYLSSDGMVLEGPRSTVVLATGKSLVTPRPENGILAGTTVDALFRVASGMGYTCTRADVAQSDLVDAESLWLVSSITLAARVTALDGVALTTTGAVEEFRTMVDLAVRGDGDHSLDR
ncbi:MAG: aminodeoxychorismate lyase [Rhodococcus sp. (in: high G+C Gram-positive bacteria)]